MRTVNKMSEKFHDVFLLKVRIRAFFATAVVFFVLVTMGVAAEPDSSIQATNMAKQVEKMLPKLETLVPEVHIYDRIALARFTLRRAKFLHDSGQHEAGRRAFQEALARYEEVQKAYLAFASQMINVSPKIAELCGDFYTLPAFFQRLEQPETAPCDAIDEFYRNASHPQPKWIHLPSATFLNEPWLFGPDARLQRYQKVRVARLEFELKEKPQLG